MPPKKFSPKPDESNRARRTAALSRLQKPWMIDHVGEEWDAGSEPTITPMLKAVDGGIARIIEALRCHGDPDGKAFLAVYDRTSKTDRQLVSIEEMAYAAGTGSLRLAEVTQTALYLHGQMRVNMLLSSHLPAVVATSLRLAKQPRFLADREWMLKAGKILPIPKGAQIAIQVPQLGSAAEEKPQTPLWMDAGQRLREIHDMTEQRRLPAPDSDPVPIGGRLDKMHSYTAEMVHVQPTQDA